MTSGKQQNTPALRSLTSEGRHLWPRNRHSAIEIRVDGSYLKYMDGLLLKHCINEYKDSTEKTYVVKIKNRILCIMSTYYMQLQECVL